MPILTDTGILYALADSDDKWHAPARKFVSSLRESLLAPVTVIPEVCYLLSERLGPRAELRFVQAVANAEIRTEGLSAADWDRLPEIMKKYPDLGFVDASIVCIAERLRLTDLLTTDRRHFSRVRPKHVTALRLLPEGL